MSFALVSVSSIVAKLRKDLREREARASEYCNQNEYRDCKPNCKLVWSSIERTERYCARMEKIDSSGESNFFSNEN